MPQKPTPTKRGTRSKKPWQPTSRILLQELKKHPNEAMTVDELVRLTALSNSQVSTGMYTLKNALGNEIEKPATGIYRYSPTTPSNGNAAPLPASIAPDPNERLSVHMTLPRWVVQSLEFSAEKRGQNVSEYLTQLEQRYTTNG
jgi:hypothetical protein